jgi:Spy/CpxP family protein refolding chaperone
MRTIWKRPMLWVFATAIAGLLAVGDALAQEVPAAGSTTGGTETKEEAPDRLEHLSQELNLSPEQKDKLRPILKQQEQEMIALRHDPNLTEEQKRAKEREIHQTFKPQIESVLAPQQRTKFRQMRRQVIERRHARRGGPPPTATAPPK